MKLNPRHPTAVRDLYVSPWGTQIRVRSEQFVNIRYPSLAGPRWALNNIMQTPRCITTLCHFTVLALLQPPPHATHPPKNLSSCYRHQNIRIILDKGNALYIHDRLGEIVCWNTHEITPNPNSSPPCRVASPLQFFMGEACCDGQSIIPCAAKANTPPTPDNALLPILKTFETNLQHPTTDSFE